MTPYPMRDINMGQDPWQPVLEHLNELVQAVEWPQKYGMGREELYFGTPETADIQVQAYWRYAVDRQSVHSLAEELGITDRAARKRVEKIRNYLALRIVGGHDMVHKLKTVDVLKELGFDAEQAARFMMQEVDT